MIKNDKISNIDRYMDKNYPHARLIEKNSLILPNFLQEDVSKDLNNCSLTSILRVTNFYIPDLDKKVAYNKLYRIAKTRGYIAAIGTLPGVISLIANSFFKNNDIPLKSSSVYFFRYFYKIKNEIDNKRPFLMNLAVGYYRNHTVTVVGYREYFYKDLKVKILEVIDGWTQEVRYIDYSVLNGLFSLPLYSFNLFRYKERGVR